MPFSLFLNSLQQRITQKIPHTVVSSFQIRIVELLMTRRTKPQFLPRSTLTRDLHPNLAHAGTD